jgi:hypothetical protein
MKYESDIAPASIKNAEPKTIDVEKKEEIKSMSISESLNIIAEGLKQAILELRDISNKLGI